MSAHTTETPSAASRRSVAGPIPDAPPVTIATFPTSRIDRPWLDQAAHAAPAFESPCTILR